MLEFVFDIEKRHIFVLADLGKENKYVQLLEIDKNKQINTGMMLNQQMSVESFSARVRLFTPILARIFEALQIDAALSTKMDIKDIQNKNKNLNDDMFMVCIIESILKQYIETNDILIEAQIENCIDSMSTESKVLTFNLWKQNILW